MPDASIIVAAWNAQRTIVSAIESALRQTSVTVEVIVADDASTDATAQAVESMHDPRVVLVRLPANGGPSAARNAAIAAAKGDWIAVLDADDTMLPGRLAELIGKGSAYGLDIVADNMWVEEAGGGRRLFIAETLDSTIERVSLATFCLRNRLFAGDPGYGYLKPVFRASFLKDVALHYDEAMRIGEDFKLVADALALGGRYGRLRSAHYNYIVAPGSISHVLSHANASAMLAADDRFLARFGSALSPIDHAAMQRHRRSLRDGVAFISMVDHIKRRDASGLIRQAILCPAALRHFSMPIKARLSRFGQGAVWMRRSAGALAGAKQPSRA